MSEPSILAEIDARGVASVYLNRPQLHNAFDEVLIADLTSLLQRLGEDPAVRALVLGGKGKNFSAGADLTWMQRIARNSEADNVADAQQLARLMHTLNQLPIPTIARVHGAAFGGGVGLVACCDLVVASDHASFCLSEVRLGLIPAVISPYVVGKMGVSAARRYFLTAETINPVEAQRLGLVHEIADQDELDDQVERWLKRLLANGPHALGAAKALIQHVAGHRLDQHLQDDTAHRIARIRASDEGQEGLAAFLDKRKPNWTAS